MSQIDRDQMVVLHSAAECRSTAESAAVDIQTKEVAYQINNAANCGEYSAEYLQELLPDVYDALIAAGYTVRKSGLANKNSSVVISWRA